MGEAPDAIRVLDPEIEVDALQIHDSPKMVYLTQTTLSLNDTRRIVEKLKQRFPQIKGPASEDICYATQNRQSAVLELAQKSDLILVVGSANSSNSRRLVEVAQTAGVPAYLIDDVEDIQTGWLKNVKAVGLTAGASAPESLVQKVVGYLKDLGFPEVVSKKEIVENIEFSLPTELAKAERKLSLGALKSAGD